MKVRYVDEAREHLALSSKKFCPICGAHSYITHTVYEEGKWPFGHKEYYVSCPSCGYSTNEFYIKRNAIRSWKEGR